MIPGILMQLEELPLNSNGKVDYRALPDPVVSKRNSYIPPQSELEFRMVKIWADILGTDKDKIGLDDGFFGLGGNSLKVVQLSQRIENELGVSIPVAEFFDYDSINGIIANLFKTKVENKTAQDNNLRNIINSIV
jgi:acyl carrier protein